MSAKKILIIGPSWIGDMVMSQSLYMTLKQQDPDALIDVLAPAWCKPILERMPEVNQAIEMPLGHGEFNFFGRRGLGKQLKNEHYTHAYILPNSAKSALIPWFAGIPTRIGWTGEMRYGLLNDIRPNKKSFQYMVERYIALGYPKVNMIDSSSLGGLDKQPYPSLHIDKIAQDAALEKHQLNRSQKAIGLSPGAAFGTAKMWSQEHYATVAETMCEKGYQVWIFGSQNDLPVCENIVSSIPSEFHSNIHILAGKTSLIEAVDLLAACESVVSNDSGLMHVASAVGCYVVGVYGPTSPDYAPPLTHTGDILYTGIECSPCKKRECPLGHSKCMKELYPTQVLECLERQSVKVLAKEQPNQASEA
ncbi:lipopolysaccharide heptosyltransferase II [Vibrio cortegadensis]|uniref:lipopolysaccharide heptosyltransferase II n=1 Tax=Vibrio cortegadensis TaxID=1328770 RepID=UPI0021C334F3|nr:lipopolysaccharide heptosyltransferase II [Vibrio cortegadensis]MDN3697708.1 lipopolysaccharide heptosyltransferase II [Vibrio cortegadensis]